MANKGIIFDSHPDYQTTKRDDKFGIVDYHGNQIVEPVFKRIIIKEEYTFFELEGYGEAIFPTSKLREL